MENQICLYCNNGFSNSHNYKKKFCSLICGYNYRKRNSVNQENLWKNINIPSEDECWEWQGHRNQYGYGRISTGGNKKMLVHRVVYEIKVGIIPFGMKLLHTCDNRKCCNPKHLKVGTQKDNLQDMFSKKRNNNVNGENSPKSKLKEEEVIEIIKEKTNYKRGDRFRLAKKYKVSVSAIDSILYNKSWKHISNTQKNAQ